MRSTRGRSRLLGSLLSVLLAAGCAGSGGGTSSGTDDPQSIQSFAAVQEVFDQSCNFSACHSAVSRQGGLVLDHEETSLVNLVEQEAQHPDARAMGLLRVRAGDPENSFLIRKLRGLGPGDAMPQGSRPLPEETIQMVEEWIARGARTTDDECASSEVVCEDQPPPRDDFQWEPEPALEVPEPGKGLQLYTPARDVEPGEEWETCYAFRPDFASAQTLNIERQEYRMHEGSHHLLVYMYFGQHPEQFAEGYYPCQAGNCVNPGDCPSDSDQLQFPIGGTQVAGTRYVVEYPAGVGLPVLGQNAVIIANLHYTNPFFPRQRIYGESWINLHFHEPGGMKAVLDGIFAINYRDLIVEPYETKTISRVWNPRSFLDGSSVDAAVFQLFGHMHKRGRLFTIDFVTEQGDATEIYRTSDWDHAPVQDYDPPYLRVDKEQGLRWTCTHRNGTPDDPSDPPKLCHEGCEACGWDDASRTCIFTRDGSGRVYAEGEPMPLVFGLLADDDMCNMFGYFLHQDDLARLP